MRHKKIFSFVFFVFCSMLQEFSLASDPRGDLAFIGENGWLVFKQNLPDYRRTNQFSSQHLERLKSEFGSAADKSRKFGGALLWVIAPNTTTVYPESVPRRISVTENNTRIDQISELLSEKWSKNFLNLAPALMQQKNKYLLYRKTDTHWSDFGAYFGYVELLNRLSILRPEFSEKLSPIPLDGFNSSRSVKPGGDIAKLLNLQNEITEEYTFLNLPRNTSIKIKETQDVDPRGDGANLSLKNPAWPTLLFKNELACPGPKLFIMRDSYFESVLPWLANHFCEILAVRYLNAPLDWGIVERERPDFIVLQNVERLTDKLIDSSIGRLE